MSFFVISYKRKDIEFVKEVKNQLHANGFVAWYDDNIQGGDDWKIVIDNAIKDFLGVILVVTPAALASQYVTYEWSFALGRDKKVIPVILEHPDPNDLDSPQMHPRLLDKNYRDFSVADNQPWEKLFEDLTAIRQALLITPMLQQAANGLRTNPDSKAWPPIIQTIENSRDNSATEVLAQFIEHDQDQISIQCALALSRKTMHQDQRAIPGLQRALKTSVERNQLEASIDALGKIGGDDAIQCLIEVYDELKTIHTVDERIARILHHSNNPLAMDVFRAILRYLGNGNNRKVAGIAALALGKLKDKSVLPDLVTIIKNPKEYEPTRINAIEAIGELGDATAVPDLIQELNKFPRTLDYKFAEPIVKALARIGSDDAINYLEQRRRAHDPNNWLGRVIKANLPTG